MKKFFAVLAGALALALAVPAEASWNIRQKGSGATVWTDGSVEVPTGDTGLVVKITDVGTAGTHFVVSHKKGTIVKVYGVSNGSTGATPSNLIFKIGDGSNNTFTPVSALSLALTTASGRKSSATTTLNPGGVTRTNVDQGDVIAIYSDGAGNNQDAHIVIVIE